MRAHYGCTPTEFITECRVAHAALLLATTTDPIGTIAYATSSPACSGCSSSDGDRRLT
ncbi:MAG: helix-turn-helix domain-containing protein [Nocardioidaceae bacterium]